MEEVCTDLTSMLQVFMEEHAELQNNPLFIAGQSYGGRTAAALPYYLLRAIETGDLHCNLKGTAIGNGYTSPPDILVNLAPMAYQMSLIDDVQYEQANEYAWAAYFEAENGNWTGYYQYQSKMWETNIGTNVYPYNVLVHPPTSIYSTNIDDFMNGPIKEKLGIIPDDKQYAPYGRAGVSLDDFDLPVWHLVDEVLKTSDVDVIVYSGQFDWICNTAGALRWMEKLTWDGREDFEKAERKLLTNPVTDVAEMFVKSQGQLKMYWVLNSGHVVPNDVPDTAMRMLNRILDDIDWAEYWSGLISEKCKSICESMSLKQKFDCQKHSLFKNMESEIFWFLHCIQAILHPFLVLYSWADKNGVRSDLNTGFLTHSAKRWE